MKNPKVFRALSYFYGLCLVLSPAGHSDELQDLKKRIDVLEEAQKQQNEDSSGADSGKSVQSFFRDNLTLGGFYEGAMTEISGPNTPTQASTATNTLGLNLAGQFSDDLRFSSQVITTLGFPILNFDNNPTAAQYGLPAQRQFGSFTASTDLAEGYLEYRPSDGFFIQGGEGYVPFGIALQQRELVLFVRRNGPQLISTFDLVNVLWSGIHIGGSFPVKRSRVGYDAYSFSQLSDSRVPGLGLRAWWKLPEDVLTLGVSSQTARRLGYIYKVVGGDAQLKLGKLGVDTEYVYNFSPPSNLYSTYIQPDYVIYGDNVLAYIFADFSNDPLNTFTGNAGAIPDPYRRLEYGGGLNWLPTSFTRLRFGVFLIHYVGTNAVVDGQNRDFVAFDLSGGVAF